MRFLVKMVLAAGAVLVAKWVYDTFVARPAARVDPVPAARVPEPRSESPEPPAPPITFRNAARVD